MKSKQTLIVMVILLLVVAYFVVNQLHKGTNKGIKIALIVPLSGPNSSIGIGMRNSSQLAIDQYNREQTNEILKVTMVEFDDASKADLGVNAVLRVAQDPNVVAVNGHYNTPVALAAKDVYHKNLLPVIIYGVGRKITREKPVQELFRLPPYDDFQMYLLAKYVSSFHKDKSVFLLDDGTSYGKPMSATLFSNFQNLKVNVKGQESITVGDMDFSAILLKVKRTHAEILIVASVFKEAALICRQMSQVGLSIPIVGVSGLFSDSFIETAGIASEGVVAPWVVAPLSTLPGGQQFARSYAQAGFKDPYEAEGIPAYTGMKLLLTAISKVGPDRSKIRDYLSNNEMDSPMGKVKFDAMGDNIFGSLTFYQVQNGKWVSIYHTNKDSSIVPEIAHIPFKE